MIAIINGPNLNMLSMRDRSIYGSNTLEGICRGISEAFPDQEFFFFQSNSEGEIIDAIQKYGQAKECSGIVINPGAYAHYSYAIADALRDAVNPAIEVHLSNIHAREEFRRHSVTADACKGVITGLGEAGYLLAVSYLLSL